MSERKNPLPCNEIGNQKRRTNRARKFPKNTCPASRHVHMMAEALARGEHYHMFEEEPEHCAGSLLSVLESLWKLRTKAGWPDAKDKAEFKRQMLASGKFSHKEIDTALNQPTPRGNER